MAEKNILRDIFPNGVPTKKRGSNTQFDWPAIRVKLEEYRARQPDMKDARPSEKAMTMAAYVKRAESELRRIFRNVNPDLANAQLLITPDEKT